MNSGQSGAGYSPVIFYNRYPWGYHSQQNPSDFPVCNPNPYVADELTKRQVRGTQEQHLDQLFLGPEQLTTHTWQLSKEPGIEQLPGTLSYDGYRERPIRQIHHNRGDADAWYDTPIIEHFGKGLPSLDVKGCVCILAVVIILILFFYQRKS